VLSGIDFINVILAAFSGYVLALVKNSYKKRERIMLMKLTTSEVGHNFVGKTDCAKLLALVQF